MNQLMVIDQILSPSTNIFYNSSVKTNYANYRTNSATNGHEALIDTLENTLIILLNSSLEKENSL